MSTLQEYEMAISKVEKLKKLMTRMRQVAKKYNVPLGTYYNLMKSQEHKCALCTKHRDEFDKDFAVDHCHTTGKIRGLLCQECNLGLGKFKDDTIVMDKAISYLNAAKETK